MRRQLRLNLTKPKGKTMRKIIGSSLLVLALSCAAYAGHIPNDNPIPTPPQPSPASVSQEPSGNNVQDQQTTESTVIEVALSLLNSVLSLF
jgi:hypothetical protein